MLGYAMLCYAMLCYVRFYHCIFDECSCIAQEQTTYHRCYSSMHNKPVVGAQSEERSKPRKRQWRPGFSSAPSCRPSRVLRAVVSAPPMRRRLAEVSCSPSRWPSSKLLVLIFAPCFRSDNRTLFVFVMEWLGVALRVLQDPSEDTLVRNHRPARHVVASNVLQKRGFVEFLAIDQPRAPNERAAGLALSEMYQTPPCRRAAANLPIFLSGEDFVQPVFLHDQSKLSAPLDAAPPTSRFLLASTIDIASVAGIASQVTSVVGIASRVTSVVRIASRVTIVVRIALRIPCSRASLRSSVLFETWETKLGATALGLAPTPSEVLAFLLLHRLHDFENYLGKHLKVDSNLSRYALEPKWLRKKSGLAL